jgi:hypothetical protein
METTIGIDLSWDVKPDGSVEITSNLTPEDTAALFASVVSPWMLDLLNPNA